MSVLPVDVPSFPDVLDLSEVDSTPLGTCDCAVIIIKDGIKFCSFVFIRESQSFQTT